MRRQVRVPMAEMLIKYCMLPYHAAAAAAAAEGEIAESGGR